MSFTLLFYRPAADPPIHPDDLAAALAALPGVELAESGDGYRPGRWRHAATGASAAIDLGEPPLERDDLHPPRAYEGWTPLALAWHLPLAGPHWLAVEAFIAVEDLLARLPGVRALDPEDVHEREDGSTGPGAWSRPRLIASWELQRRDRCQDLAEPAMARGASLRLWRYRRELAQARAERPDLHWGEALVLLDRDREAARSACLWPDRPGDWALPPVELVVVRRPDGALVVESAGLPDGDPLPALARHIAGATAPPAGGRPAQRFQALLDHDWRDG
jgi:hypothetical protein